MEMIIDRLLDLAARQYGLARGDLRPEADLYASLGIDSFQALDLLTRLEDEFACEIPDYELQDVTTFAGLAEVIARRA
jgi:acyl carrier protein